LVTYLIILIQTINKETKDGFITMYWFLDFESYKIGRGEYVVNEISILASDGKQCYTYLVKSPKHFYVPENHKTLIYQYTRHRLPWNFGDYTFKDAIEDILKKVGICNV
jgi:hypothetical protein